MTRRRSKEQIEKDLELGSKVCCTCGERKTLGDFYNKKDTVDGKTVRCKVCSFQAIKEHRVRNEEGYKEVKRRYKLKSTFGITIEQYDSMLEEQGGVCKICGCIDGAKRLSVDHDHSTGAVRALLCSNCNRAIGYLQDNSNLVRKAADYLDSY